MTDDMNLTSSPGMIPDYSPEGIVWFAYVHVNGSLHIKRYCSWGDYKEAGDSDFVLYCTKPFDAKTRDEAQKEGGRLIVAHYGEAP